MTSKFGPICTSCQEGNRATLSESSYYVLISLTRS
ncbi:hypothetical protein OIU77_025731 [Salix suchowensis]|uniref:Uncharacterized protein n=1 Tax=Salix suchowensis TaxID=1278906 RepID=A0ABQ9BX86_9ROSI|nr:hypothetical protein OIU77_025731 [Salix suchowensis]